MHRQGRASPTPSTVRPSSRRCRADDLLCLAGYFKSYGSSRGIKQVNLLHVAGDENAAIDHFLSQSWRQLLEARSTEPDPVPWADFPTRLEADANNAFLIEWCGEFADAHL